MLQPPREFKNAVKERGPMRSLSDPIFVKCHLAISRGEYDQIYKARNARAYTNDSLGMVEVIDPTSDQFLDHLRKVGHLYGWDRRQKYQPENCPALDAMMTKPETRLFIFKLKGQDVGFCLTAGIESDLQQTQGHSKDEIINHFRIQRRLPANSRPIEILKIGLYDEFTGQGHGNAYLAKMLEILFDRGHYDIVYLNTRDTNHQGVLRFYARNGIDVFFEESLPNDLVPDNPQSQQLSIQPSALQP
jgi:ribosomal protein S18 acetylase RimI-like enzyme